MAEPVEWREVDGKVRVRSPYSAEFVRLAKQSGGKWDAAGRAWVWDSVNADLAKRAVLDCYGIDVDDGIAPSLVTVEVDAGALPEDDGRLLLDGVTLARRYGRDDPVRLASNVVVIEGSFPSYGGSRAHPAVCAGEGTWLRVRDVLPSQLACLRNHYSADDWRLVTPESERVDALRRERAELVARLEKIDAELASLTDGVECRPVAISMHHAGLHFQV